MFREMYVDRLYHGQFSFVCSRTIYFTLLDINGFRFNMNFSLQFQDSYVKIHQEIILSDSDEKRFVKCVIANNEINIYPAAH